MNSDLFELPVHALSTGLATRRFSPVDLVEACLARIAALEPRLQAFVHVHGAQARLAAEAADKAIRAGHGVGPLHGIPIALKDLVEFKGHVTTGGCAVWRGPASSSTPNLSPKTPGAGRILLGQTHHVEIPPSASGTTHPN